MKSDEDACHAAGMDGFLPKPIELLELRCTSEPSTSLSPWGEGRGEGQHGCSFVSSFNTVSRVINVGTTRGCFARRRARPEQLNRGALSSETQ